MHTRYFFPLAKRCLRSNDFKTVFKQGKRWRNRNLYCCFLKNNLDSPRLGLIIAKRKIKTAVQRNRIKRLLRQKLRISQHEFPQALDIIIGVEKSFGELDKAQQQHEIESLWQQLITYSAKS